MEDNSEQHETTIEARITSPQKRARHERDDDNLEEEKQQSYKSSSRLRLLRDHGILNDVILCLDEVDLYQFQKACAVPVYQENDKHDGVIGSIEINKHWARLRSCDQSRVNHRWLQDDSNRPYSMSEALSPDLWEHKMDRDRGVEFAKDALFVRAREKEALDIYDFDRKPLHENDVPMKKSVISQKSDRKKQSYAQQHWSQWFDYRKDSVNKKHAFVRFTLRDGSHRCWEGYRKIETHYNTTFFRMRFTRSELMKDMNCWWFGRSTSTSSSGAKTSHEAKALVVGQTQLTIAFEDKLLIATGGISKPFSDVSDSRNFAGERYFFHARHYDEPLADHTKNDLEWKPYRSYIVDNCNQDEIVFEFDCDHANLPFMRASDIGDPNAAAHW